MEPYLTDAVIDTKIDSLIGAAPGALDTLNELAAALDDDPNFATTVTNQLALKASISAVFGSLSNNTIPYYDGTDFADSPIDVNVDVTTVNGQIVFTSPDFPVTKMYRTTSDTNNFRGMAQYLNKTTQNDGNTQNGIGAGVNVGVSYANRGDVTLGYFGALRDGDWDQGKFVIAAIENGGFNDHQFEFRRTGWMHLVRAANPGINFNGPSIQKTDTTRLQVNAEDLGVKRDGWARITGESNDSSSSIRPVFSGRKSRGTGSNLQSVQNNDRIFSFLASGHDGTNYQNAAAIDFLVDGTVSNDNVPISMFFATGANGTRINRMKIGGSGGIEIYEDTEIDGELTLNNNRILNVSTPTDDTDAANKAYADSKVGGSAVTASKTTDTFYTDMDTAEVITFDNEVVDRNNEFNGTTFTAAKAGTYYVDCLISGADLSNQPTAKVFLRVNQVNLHQVYDIHDNDYASLTTHVVLNAGDDIDIYYDYQNVTISHNTRVGGRADRMVTRLNIHQIV
jgi:hypothetical protein